jgi:acetyltransferase-like isoleucine patch superfamily enzyme
VASPTRLSRALPCWGRAPASAVRSGVAPSFDPVWLAFGDALQDAWERLARRAAIGPRHRRARRFRRFGERSAICFPTTALFGEAYIEIGDNTIVGPHASLSAGVSPVHVPDPPPVLRIGDRCLIGRGSGIVAHRFVEIGDDVFTGHHVYVTDANHGYEDPSVPIGCQFAPPKPVRIGAGSWLGHGTIVLPGADIGRHVAVGAGSVVTGRLPDFSVAVGNPARVIKVYEPDSGWIACHPAATGASVSERSELAQRANGREPGIPARTERARYQGRGYDGGASAAGSEVSTVTDVESS